MNAVAKVLDCQQIAGEILEGLKQPPPKKPRVVEEVTGTIYPGIKAARDAGWNWKDILVLVRSKGVKISAARLKKLYEQRLEKETPPPLFVAKKNISNDGAS